MHAEAQNRNIKCKTLHFFGAMLAKLERQAELEFPNIEPKIRLETFLDAYPETAEIYLDATGLLLENIIIEPIQQTSSQVDLLDDIIEDLIDVPPESHDDNCTEDEDINRLNSKLRI